MEHLSYSLKLGLNKCQAVSANRNWARFLRIHLEHSLLTWAGLANFCIIPPISSLIILLICNESTKKEKEGKEGDCSSRPDTAALRQRTRSSRLASGSTQTSGYHWTLQAAGLQICPWGTEISLNLHRLALHSLLSMNSCICTYIQCRIFSPPFLSVFHVVLLCHFLYKVVRQLLLDQRSGTHLFDNCPNQLCKTKRGEPTPCFL